MEAYSLLVKTLHVQTVKKGFANARKKNTDTTATIERQTGLDVE